MSVADGRDRPRPPADNTKATLRGRVREARLDAAGLCRRCGAAPRTPGRTACAACRERIAADDKGRERSRTARTPLARVRFCIDCQASNFHRHDCPTQNGTP